MGFSPLISILLQIRFPGGQSLRCSLQCRKVISSKGNALGIITWGGEGTERDLAKEEIGLRRPLLCFFVLAEKTGPLYPSPLYHSGIGCAWSREGAWPQARQFFPAKAIPKNSWQLRAVCQQHSQAAGAEVLLPKEDLVGKVQHLLQIVIVLIV